MINTRWSPSGGHTGKEEATQVCVRLMSCSDRRAKSRSRSFIRLGETLLAPCIITRSLLSSQLQFLLWPPVMVALPCKLEAATGRSLESWSSHSKAPAFHDPKLPILGSLLPYALPRLHQPSSVPLTHTGLGTWLALHFSSLLSLPSTKLLTQLYCT